MTFTPSTNTVVWGGTANSITITSAGKAFYNFTIAPYNWSDNYALAGDVTINHTFIVTNSNCAATVSGAYSFICNGDVKTNDTYSSYIRRYSETEATKISIAGSSDQTIGHASKATSFGLTVDVTSSGGTVYFQGTINIRGRVS